MTDAEYFVKGFVATLGYLDAPEETSSHEGVILGPILELVQFSSLFERVDVGPWVHYFVHLHHLGERDQAIWIQLARQHLFKLGTKPRVLPLWCPLIELGRLVYDLAQSLGDFCFINLV